MKLEDRILTGIFLEYKETYKTYLGLNDYLTPTADGIRNNLWMLRSEFYKRKSQVLEKILSNEREVLGKHEQKRKFCSYCGKRKFMKGDGTIEMLCQC